MRIKSKFKDYYDYIAHRYGGGDPRVVYIRGMVGGGFGPRGNRSNSDLWKRLYRDAKSVHPVFQHWFFYEDSGQQTSGHPRVVIDRALLIVAGRCFPLIGTPRPPSKGGMAWCIDTWMMANRTRRFPPFRRSRKTPVLLPEFGIESQPWIEFCQVAQAPVFILRSCFRTWEVDDIGIEPMVPTLAYLGLPALMSAEDVYQQIAYYVGNVCRESPDIRPPVEVRNRDKIVGHGFDPVTSFRSMKTPDRSE